MEGGLDLEKQTSIPVEAELFFLTSLFIELIGPRSVRRQEIHTYLESIVTAPDISGTDLYGH